MARLLWSKVACTIVAFSQFFSLTRSSCNVRRIPELTVYQSRPGQYLLLRVPANVSQYTWKKDGGPLDFRRYTLHTDAMRAKARIYTVRDGPGLWFTPVTITDRGKYILEVFCSEMEIHLYSFLLIVRDETFLFTDCSDMTVSEGRNITCLCKAINVQGPTQTTWITPKGWPKSFTEILKLENVSRSESGKYTCSSLVENRNVVYNASFQLNVMPAFTADRTPPALKVVKIEYFKAFQEIGLNSSKIFLYCEAGDTRKPTVYTIMHNGGVVKYGNTHIIDASKASNLGLYECLIHQPDSSSSLSLSLNADVFIQRNKTDTRHVFGKQCNKIDWKIKLAIGCSFLAGILFARAFSCVWKVFTESRKSKMNSRDVSLSSEALRMRNPNDEFWPNDDMQLRDVKSFPGKHEYDLPNIGNTKDNHCFKEGGYQELSKSRDKEEGKYKSLIRVKKLTN